MLIIYLEYNLGVNIILIILFLNLHYCLSNYQLYYSYFIIQLIVYLSFRIH
jgi:hypothetical protein